MYNHYIPQSDGSYRRSTVHDAARRPAAARPQPPEPPKKPPQEPPSPAPPPPPPGESILDFLKGLLPRQIDTADLMVILLILLMTREEDGDSFSPMLTLALYFLL